MRLFIVVGTARQDIPFPQPYVAGSGIRREKRRI